MSSTLTTSGLITPLYPHQNEGLRRYLAAERRLYLHWGMGAGKTLGTLAILDHDRPKTALVVCPKSVLPVWESQVRIHTDGWIKTAAPLAGTLKKRAAAAAHFTGRTCPISDPPGTVRMVIVNYEAFWRSEMGKLVLNEPWGIIVYDEAHRLKAPGGKASRFATQLRKKARAILMLSGTMMPHSPLDAYAQIRALDPTIFGHTFAGFRSQYAVLVDQTRKDGRHYPQIMGYRNLDHLAECLAPIMHEVRTEDVVDLPEESDIVLPVVLPPVAQRIYDQLAATFIAGVGSGVVTASNALVRLLRLQQLTGGWLPVENDATGEIASTEIHTGKQDALAEFLDSLPGEDSEEGPERVAVFCRFHADLDSVHKAAILARRRSWELSGRRHDISGCWDHPGSVGAIQIKSGGLGIDLSAAKYAVFYSVGNISPGDYQQARRRVRRPNSKGPRVFYYHLACVNTVDEVCYKAIASRQSVIDKVLDWARKGGE